MTGVRHSFKIVVVGSSGVGKTALVQRLVDDNFRENSQSTVGVEFKSYVCQCDGQAVKLQIWDTAGQERFRSVSKAYFRNAVGAILVYDITNPDTFDDISRWLEELLSLSNPNAFLLLVGNKSDLESDRKVGAQQGRDYAATNKMEFLEASASSGANVEEAFSRLAHGIVQRILSGQITTTLSAPIASNWTPTKEPSQKKSGCC